MIEHERTGPVDQVTWRLSRIAMILPAVIVGVMFFEVVARYVFAKPTLWANELSLWLAGMVYLLAGLYAMQQRSHIRIFILYDVAPRWLQHLFDVISTLLLILFCLATIWGGFGEAWAKLMRWETFGTAWDPPIPATMKPLILVTLVLMMIQAVSNLICDWNREPEKHDALEEIDIDVEELRAEQEKLESDQDRG
ncbi:TRAP transporter small permease subunit [Oceanomicrobium pacificus]|uniref:TRAP transporter small permease protein n=1 Tax=Oceanomicrobium pacificus TaxID=2692916 RepID=A0A6B0TZF2_9RHOB|nr:TRAP transporter small permease [Oceanomicrobium pacificus]MXU66642.1 TRAP transporter small permease subunit [Oceanomicrobium pacificus]